MPVLRHLGQDVLNVVYEAHVEHLIGFVKDAETYAVKVQRSTFQMVLYPSWSANDYVGSFFEAFELDVVGGSSIDCKSPYVAVGSKALYLVAYLDAQLPCRHKHQGSCLMCPFSCFVLLVQLFKNWKGERCRFAGSRLCLTYQVLVAFEEDWYAPLLYLCWMFKSLVCYGLYAFL